MTDITNAKRAEAAAEGLLAYAKAKEGRFYDVSPEVLTDLLNDLMHWADRNRFRFNDCCDRARLNYEEERFGEYYERLADSIHEVFEALKNALEELKFQQKHYPRADDTKLRETIHKTETLIETVERGQS